MSLLLIIGIAFGLALDAFAVAIASSIALGTVSPRQTFRLSFHFGLFQAMMPVLGWMAGLSMVGWIQAWDHWVAFGLLSLIGCKALCAAFHDDDGGDLKVDPTRGLTLVILSVATSVDALAVGLSFAMLNVKIWYPSAIIGVVAAVMTLLGMHVGGRLGRCFGRQMEAMGGIVLIAIGVKILIEHLH
jgi:manganese efflux pump family protein